MTTTSKCLREGYGIGTLWRMRNMAGWIVIILVAGMVLPCVADDSADGPVYVLAIRENISRNTEYLVRRGLNEAAKAKAKMVILDMDTYGGRVDSMETILQLLGRAPMPTVTFVNSKAISAGALISAGTDTIYMAPGSVIGAAAPVIIAPGDGVKEMPKAYQEKNTSAIRAMVRSAAQAKGHNPDVFQAMIDEEFELKIGETVICEEGKLLTLTNVEAAKDYGDPPQPLLSRGTVDKLEDVLMVVGMEKAEVRRVEPHGFEVLARWIEPISPLLISLGILAILIELYTPGIGVPSMAAALFFTIFFIGYFAAGLAGWEAVVLFGIGVVLLAVEIFVLPGFGVAGILGIGSMLMGLLIAMTERWPGGPVLPSLPDLREPLMNLGIGVVVAIAMAVVVLRFLPHVPLFRSLELATVLETNQGFSAGTTEPVVDVGAVGEAETDLRLSGKGQFGGTFVDVVSDGDLIEKGSPIRVTRVEGSRVYVSRHV